MQSARGRAVFSRSRIRSFIFALLALLALSTMGVGLPEPSATMPAAPAAIADSAAAAAPVARTPGGHYGPFVLAPPVLTIVLAIALRQVIPALLIGVLIAAGMLAWHAQPPDSLAASGAFFVASVRGAVETYVVGALADESRLKIILFTLLIGAMVGIIARNGGTQAIVHAVAGWASTRRRGQVATWFAGLVVFFDDYANAMIVGPSMRPICDRLRISRAKLAYLVDSTAAPVSSIALIGTWIGTEIGFIQEGLDGLAARPDFLIGVNGYDAFLTSLAYRFYPILALVMVLLVGWLDRDFGPMLRAEREQGQAPEPTAAGDAVAGGRAWYAGVPVLILVGVTLVLLGTTGWAAVQAEGEQLTGFELLRAVISNADSYNAILYGAFAAAVAAAIISLATFRLNLAETMDAATDTMARMLSTIMILTLAWALSDAMQALELGEVARGLLQSGGFNVHALPLLIFASACVVSFATGTSWGTMGILCPAAVTIAAGLVADLPADTASRLFYASVGAVLAGAVFGDHCSPISDTTVLSSIASDCRLEEHVWTQMPYAVVVAAVSVLMSDILGGFFGLPWWAGLALGVAALVLILLAFGRRCTLAPVQL